MPAKRLPITLTVKQQERIAALRPELEASHGAEKLTHAVRLILCRGLDVLEREAEDRRHHRRQREQSSGG